MICVSMKYGGNVQNIGAMWGLQETVADTIDQFNELSMDQSL